MYVVVVMFNGFLRSLLFSFVVSKHSVGFLQNKNLPIFTQADLYM
jgi:hypothetical protein